jgi:hypothetical protein
MNCKICGKKSDSEYCFHHKPRKRMNSYIKKYPNKVEEGIKMKDLFLEIWKERVHRSEVYNEYLGNEALTVFFHHILPKEKHSEAKFDKENIILLTFDEHGNVENDMYKYEKINNIREQLKEKYGIS